jgi:hypothetical protein
MAPATYRSMARFIDQYCKSHDPLRPFFRPSWTSATGTHPNPIPAVGLTVQVGLQLYSSVGAGRSR